MKKMYYIGRKGTRRIKKIILKEKEIMGITNYVEQKLTEKDRENLEKTRKVAMDYLEYGRPLVAKFEEKIQKYCIKYGTTRGEVLASIVSDPVAASAFAKSANRQRTAEKAQLRYLQEERAVRIERLPSSGHNSIRLNDGELVFGNVPKTISSTKTFDAVSKNGHTTDYVFVKYTCGYGGAQDNQAMDAVLFLEAAHDYVALHDDNVRFVAILDGDYYTRHWDVFKEFHTDRVLVETSDTYKIRGRRAVYTSRGGGDRKVFRTRTAN